MTTITDKYLRKTNIATWNLKGKLSYAVYQQKLVEDMKLRKIDIACLQETRWNEDATIHLDHRKGNIINIQARNVNEHKRYGMGFYISKEWMKRYEGHEYVTDRIATIKFKIHHKKNKYLTIVNVYGPTNQYARDGNLEEVETFYENLKDTVTKKKRSSAIVIVAGDYNAVIGQRKDTETESQIMGRYTKGHRNINGTYMRDFLISMKLFASNTAFKHRDHHKATWHSSHRNAEGNTVGIHQQLDYIAVQQEHKALVRNSRSYNDQNFQYESDHSMVVMQTQLRVLCRLSRRRKPEMPKKLDIQRLAASGSAVPETAAAAVAVAADAADAAADAAYSALQTAVSAQAAADRNIAADFEKRVTEEFRKLYTSSTDMIDSEFFGDDIRREIMIEIDRKKTPKDIYATIHQSLNIAATHTIPEVPRRINGKIIYSEDNRLRELSLQQMRYRQQLRHIPRRKEVKRLEIWRKRSQLFKEIRNRLRELNTERIEQIAKNIEANKDNRRMYDHVKLLRRNKYKEFRLNDDKGEVIHDTKDMIEEVEKFYRDFFNDDRVEDLDRWLGESRALTKQITDDEVNDAIMRLNNN